MKNPSPTNLTDRISYLRNRKKSSEIVGKAQKKTSLPSQPDKSVSERKFATDYFMLFVYSLIVIAMISQFLLIAWLDIL